MEKTGGNGGGSNEGSSGWVTTEVAAEALKVSPRSVRTFIQRGELVGHMEEDGIKRAYMVSIDSLNSLREERKARGKLKTSSAEEFPRAEDTSEVARELIRRLESKAAEAADLKARLELTELAESTVQQERERLAADLEREKARTDRLEAELAEARRPWWRRLFGGRANQ